MCVCPGKHNVFGWKIRFLVENGTKFKVDCQKMDPERENHSVLEKNQILLFLNEFQRYDFPVPGPFFGNLL